MANAPTVSIDAYDALGVDFGATQSEIKTAYRRLSLQCHPDKMHKSGGAPGAAHKFNEIKTAYDILQDADRRKAYDAFGSDMGAGGPSQEVWSIGVSNIVAPMGSFTVKTLVVAVARWLFACCPILKLGVFTCGVGGIAKWYKWPSAPLVFGSVRIERPVSVAIVLGSGGGLVVVHCVWQLLFDACGLVYLVSEITGTELLVQNTRIFGGLFMGSSVIVFFIRRWWSWRGLFLTGCFLTFLALVSCACAASLSRMYIEGVNIQHGAKVKAHRTQLRKERKKLETEHARLTQLLRARNL